MRQAKKKNLNECLCELCVSVLPTEPEAAASAAGAEDGAA